jgi:DNA-directed RNA polymerase subunit N (RpoN/RPB10)
MRPVRCYTCGKVLGHLYHHMDDRSQNLSELWERLGVRRYCCKRTLMTSDDDVMSETYIYSLPSTVTVRAQNEVNHIVPTD